MSKDDIESGINKFATPILITVCGFFMVMYMNNINAKLGALNQYNVDRDVWVRDWIEKYQPILDWAKVQKQIQERK